MSSSSSEVMNARGLTVQFPQGGELLQQLWYDLAVAETAKLCPFGQRMHAAAAAAAYDLPWPPAEAVTCATCAPWLIAVRHR